MSDWIKIHRSLLESYAFANPVSLKIWTWMLLKANYKDSYVPLKSGKGVVSVKVKRGQFLFGRFKAEDELNIDGSMIYRQMKKFEDLEQIKIESNNQYSIVTICNYDFYQSIKDKNEQPMNSQRTTNDQQMENERTANEHIQEELEYKEELESKEVGYAGKLWFLQYYYSPYEVYKKMFNGQSTTQEFFDQWKKFIDLIYEKKYESLFDAKFVSPHSFEKLITEEKFTPDKWDETLKKILATGVKPEHDLFFRIPEFMKYLRPNGFKPQRELSEHEKTTVLKRELVKGKKES